jgi:hypothetical protein
VSFLAAVTVALSSLGVGAGASGVQQPEATGPSVSGEATVAAGLRGRAHQPKFLVTGQSPVVGALTGHRLTGPASWYCCTRGHAAGEFVAAAGPALRVGAWRGRVVRVNGLRVRLVDFCRCPFGRVIDLHPGVFRSLAPLSRGIVRVSVSW